MKLISLSNAQTVIDYELFETQNEVVHCKIILIQIVNLCRLNNEYDLLSDYSTSSKWPTLDLLY